MALELARARHHRQRGRARRDRDGDDRPGGRDPHEAERPGVPLGRPGDAHEVAALIAWLTSPEASYVTGASYVVDGGMLLMAAEANLIAMD